MGGLRSIAARPAARRSARLAVPSALLAVVASSRASLRQRAGAGTALAALWAIVYARYRRASLVQTAHERQLLADCDWNAFRRHYEERVPTIEQEFEIWGAFHQHRHEMRYDLVAEQVRRHLPAGGRVLDVGCGSILVADRILEVPASYVGVEFGGPNLGYAAGKIRSTVSALSMAVLGGNAEQLPFVDETFDVVVMTEVIEHLLRPQRAVWEVARVLRPGGVFVMTTNNASEVPLRSPLTHVIAWMEKALGAHRPELISLRPWVWPEAVSRDLLPDDSPDVYLPHTHHIYEETRRMFAAAGLETFHFSTFEFPPPQSATSQWLDRRGSAGRRVVDGIETVARRLPLVNRLGCHVFMVARKTALAIAPEPPKGVWPGPFD